MRIEWISADDLAAVEPIWRALSAGAGVTYFQSWSWVENWLRSLPPRHGVKLGVIGGSGTPLGGFFVGSALKRRHGVLLSRAKYVNETGRRPTDDLCAEFNSLLCASSAEPKLRALLDRIPGPWDELYLPALDAQRFPGNALTELGWPYRLEVLRRTPSYFVDLDAVRTRGEYLPLVGSKTRSQLRRTYRIYEADGAVTTEVAADLSTSLSIYHELVELHQRHWIAHGYAGAFATEYFRRFHRRIIEERHASGEIQLLRVRVAGRTIGCIYGFNFEGTLYQYQTGMLYDEDHRDRRPGFLCNAEAIKHNARLGLHRYDFLGGAQAYKRQLSTGERALVWARVQKPRVRFWLERGAKQLRDRWRAYSERGTPGERPAEPGGDGESP